MTFSKKSKKLITIEISSILSKFKGHSKIKSRLTKRAPDKWDSARFTSIFLASSLYCSQAFSQPAHLRVTQTVSQPKSKTKYVFDSQVSFLAKIFFSAWWFLVRKIRLFLAVAFFKVKFFVSIFSASRFSSSRRFCLAVVSSLA